MKVLGCLLLLPIITILFVLVFAAIFIFSILGRKNAFKIYTTWNSARKNSAADSPNTHSSANSADPQPQRKIFTRSDGEYVDFEEV